MGWWSSFLDRFRRKDSDWDDLKEQVRWIPASENPFGMEVLDCRAVSDTLLSVTSDPEVAERFVKLRDATGQEVRGAEPQESTIVQCNLAYPSAGEPLEGPLVKAEEMEDKWDIYFYDGYLYFTRSWTGQLVFRAKITFEPGRARITEIAAPRIYVERIDLAVGAVDFLIKRYVYNMDVPHPLPSDIPKEAQTLAMASFSEFGRAAQFGSYEDTTRFRVPDQRE